VVLEDPDLTEQLVFASLLAPAWEAIFCRGMWPFLFFSSPAEFRREQDEDEYIPGAGFCSSPTSQAGPVIIPVGRGYVTALVALPLTGPYRPFPPSSRSPRKNPQSVFGFRWPLCLRNSQCILWFYRFFGDTVLQSFFLLVRRFSVFVRPQPASRSLDLHTSFISSFVPFRPRTPFTAPFFRGDPLLWSP